jgi:hypothetical protein
VDGVFLDANVDSETDRPILLAAFDGGVTHLLTGDRAHFGRYFRQEVGGVLILPPAEYPPLIPNT